MTKLRQAAQAALDALESDAIQRTFAGGVRMSNAAIALRAALAQPPAPTAQPRCIYPNCNCPFDHPGTPGWCAKGLTAQPVQQPGAEPIGYMSPEQTPMIQDPDDGSGVYIPIRKTPAGLFTLALYTQAAPAQRQPVQQPGAEPLHGGMDNAELLAAWKKKLPGVEPSDAQLTAFAVGVEVGFAHARDLERQDWSRVHHALAKHGAHPGRTDDHIADVIDRALASPAQGQPLPPGLRRAAEFTRADLGPDGSNYPHVRELLAFAEQALGITAAPAAQKGE